MTAQAVLNDIDGEKKVVTAEEKKSTTRKVPRGDAFTLRIRCTLLTELLGTLPGDPNIYTEYIQTRCPANVEDVPVNLDPDEEIEKKTTYFRRTKTGELCLADYMIKGHLKAMGEAIRKRIRKESGAPTAATKSGWEAWVGNADQNVHVFPRLINLGVTQPDGIIERPLRAQTMHGPRVSLARSEMINADRTFEFEIHVRGGVSEEQILVALDEGKYTGYGQWRNAGYGRFIYEVLE